jgi:hypothetical protein
MSALKRLKFNTGLSEIHPGRQIEWRRMPTHIERQTCFFAAPDSGHTDAHDSILLESTAVGNWVFKERAFPTHC